MKDVVSDNSHLTAIARKDVPNPTKYIIKQIQLGNFPRGTTWLDYGCGKCAEANYRVLTRVAEIVRNYDPYYKPGCPVDLEYDIITCNYVLNTLSRISEQVEILHHIQSLLTPTGRAYITVRADIPKLKGLTKRGTWQGFVHCNTLPMIKHTSSWRMYLLTKDTRLS